MGERRVVSREEWTEERVALLEEEKALTKEMDRVSERRRALPWVKVDKDYTFTTPEGASSLADLFGGCSQLIVYHFMFGPDWEEGCKSCSFWADNFNGIDIHLKHRDASMVCVSRAPIDTLESYRKRMGWDFTWVSSFGSDFNYDYQVSFTEEEVEKDEGYYNFQVDEIPADELPGVSVFYKDDSGIYHTYSTYARGLDILNGAYRHMDILPKGRDEDDLPYTMAWLHRHDEYED